jgi:hypothetical protein
MDLPPIPEKYKDRILGPDVIAAQLGPDASQLDEHSQWKPIAIAVNVQEIGRWFVDKLSPYAFTQQLLERLKAAGAPVESGRRGLQLAHGRVAKVRLNPMKQDEWIKYVWLPDDVAKAIRAKEK